MAHRRSTVLKHAFVQALDRFMTRYPNVVHDSALKQARNIYADVYRRTDDTSVAETVAYTLILATHIASSDYSFVCLHD